MKRPRSDRAFRPSLDGRLEPRLALSGVGVQAAYRTIPLSGTIRGTFTVVTLATEIANAPTVAGFHANGSLKPIGTAVGKGSINYAGDRRGEPPIVGELVFTTRKGDLAVHVQGTASALVPGATTKLKYYPVGGTRAYHFVTGKGTVAITLASTPSGLDYAATLKFTPGK
ncbi:MAG: hypothetical protein U0800_00710 [Isosphaeraceae bacterium]